MEVTSLEEGSVEQGGVSSPTRKYGNADDKGDVCK